MVETQYLLCRDEKRREVSCILSEPELEIINHSKQVLDVGVIGIDTKFFILEEFHFPASKTVTGISNWSFFVLADPSSSGRSSPDIVTLRGELPEANTTPGTR